MGITITITITITVTVTVTITITITTTITITIRLVLSLADEQDLGKGADGVGTHGVTANLMLLDRGTFGGLPSTYFYITPRVPGRTSFPNLSKSITFAAAPLVLTPFVRNQLYFGGT